MAHVFLDLDGTLTDPKEGITRSVVHALEQVGVTPPAPEELTWVIGPALVDSFARLGVPDVQAALTHYRARFAEVGLFENKPYAGVTRMLDALAAEGHVLCLATAKPHVYARRIAERYGLAPHLAHQFGPELDGTRNDKAELLAHALAVTGAVPAQSVMVGDRHHDIAAARANGLRSVAVTWGYGTPGEWAGADAICDALPALPATIRAVLDL